jgi:hypothetical protein
MALYPVAGCKIYISNAAFPEDPNDVDSTDFVGVVWTEVKKWTQMGTFGDSSQLITTDLIGEGRTKKQKGTKNAGSMANVFAFDASDSGQAKLVAAAQSYNNYAFKVELNDKVGAQVNNSLREFYGLVMTAQQVGGGANTVQTLNCTVEINSNIVSIAAA